MTKGNQLENGKAMAPHSASLSLLHFLSQCPDPGPCDRFGDISVCDIIALLQAGNASDNPAPTGASREQRLVMEMEQHLQIAHVAWSFRMINPRGRESSEMLFFWE